MGLHTVTCWKTDLEPSKTFATRDEAEEFERTVVPRELVKSILSLEGRIDSDDEAVIDKIVARLGNLWQVRGFMVADTLAG